MYSLTHIDRTPVHSTTGAVMASDGALGVVQAGEMFLAESVTASLADGSSYDVMVTTGAAVAHASIIAGAEGAAVVYVYEGATIAEGSSEGTAVAAYNLNRGSTNTPAAAVAHTPEGVTEGTAIVQRVVTGTVAIAPELILVESTGYLVRLTNASGGAIAASVGIQFYEE